MLCPKCNKEMKVMADIVPPLKSDIIKHREVIGRCDDCDLDATWEIRFYHNGKVEEFNLQRYFFG